MHGHSDCAGSQDGKGITVPVLTFTVSIPLLYPGLQLPLDVSSGGKGGVGSLTGIHLVPCRPFASPILAHTGLRLPTFIAGCINQ